MDLKKIELIAGDVLSGKHQTADWIEELLFNGYTEEFCFAEYITTVKLYFLALNQCLLEENYELAQKIKLTLKIEEDLFIKLSTTAPWFKNTTYQDIKDIIILFNQTITNNLK